MPLKSNYRFEQIQALASHFALINRGIEKESLRITQDGCLSQKTHPQALGATLTNSHITTDYSEALPEFITGVSNDRLRPLQELDEIHRFAFQNLGDELLWSMSMPCVMGEEKDIPIARYGHSNVGKMKEIYRVGLGYRYGRFMQTIAGVHYNFSLPDAFWHQLHQQQAPNAPLQEFIDARYMGLIRNYLRYSWLIPLFFGASPALCESFIRNKNIDLEVLVPGTRYSRYATSLRMSDLGYQNNAQSALSVSYNSLSEYIDGLETAISTQDPYYQQLGVVVDGEYRQLNANILQIENEFYSSIRPKRVTLSGERPSKALRNRGIEYLEIRALDLNPFSPVGIEQSQIAFLDAFLLACLFAESPAINLREKGENQANFKRIVYKGRHPDCCLTINNHCVLVSKFAAELLQQIGPYAEILDQVYQTTDHVAALETLNCQLADLSLTYSGRVVNEIETRRDGFFPFAFELAEQHKVYFQQRPLEPDVLARYQEEAERSLAEKAAIESQDTLSFEAYLASYYQ